MGSNATQRLVAFLRAINVGGHTVKMDSLRAVFEGLELAHVETFIASGNVIFDAPGEDIQGLEKIIERHLREALGYEVTTFIRSAPELAAIARYCPFPDADLEEEGNYLYIAFLPAVPDSAAQQKVLALQTPIDSFHFHEREMYWYCRKKISESTFSGAAFEKTIAMPSTMRNSTTVRKLAAKLSVS